MKKLPLSQVYQLIEPGPVVLLTTAREGRPNVMTMSWHMMIEFEPPLIACIVGGGDYSFTTLEHTGECVIAIPSAGMAADVVKIGNCSGRDIDKFDAFKLTAVAAEAVAAPLIGECFANLECKVKDTGFVRAYNMFVLEVVRAWIDPAQAEPAMIHHRGYGTFAVDGETVTYKSKMR
jgi:flavin reductase (DIM6/NTAB) family NADH-FMN oxidoreductase RutF